MRRATAGALLLLLAARATAQSGGRFELRPGSIVGGGGASAAGAFTLEGAIERGDAGQSRGGSYRLLGGLWPAIAALPSARCAGDCGGDGRVTVDELVALVGVSLAGTVPAQCENGDVDRDGRVSIDELVAAVTRALAACP
jgi:hypothetical protein